MARRKHTKSKCICGRGCGDCPVHDVLPSETARMYGHRQPKPPLAVFEAWVVAFGNRVRYVTYPNRPTEDERNGGKPIKVRVTVERIEP